MNRYFIFIIILVVLASPVHTRAGVINKGVEELVEYLTKQASRELVAYGGKAAIRETLEKAAREGGDDLVEKVVHYGKRYGVSAVKAIDNGPAVFIESFERMPRDLVTRAVWAVQREPETIKQLIVKHGPDALLVSAKLRGVGMRLIQKFGDDGVRIGKAITEDQSVVLMKHADEIADLPASQRSKMIDMILKTPGKIIDFLEKHPATLKTAAGVTLILSLSDDVLGSHEETIVKPDGSTITIKKGVTDRIMENFHAEFSLIFIIISVILIGWGLIRIWGRYRKDQLEMKMLETDIQKMRHQQQNKKNRIVDE